jgi:hypothetical protein
LFDPRPYAMPTGVPQDRVRAVEAAFVKTLKDLIATIRIMSHMELENLLRQQQDLHKAGGLVHLVLT